MTLRNRLLALSLLAASLPATALAQTTAPESLRLHLSLGPDGRIQLSTSNDTAPAPALQPHGPLAFGDHPLRRYAIDLSTSAAANLDATGCSTANAVLRLGPLSGCDLLDSGYDGLPGAIRNLDVGLHLSDRSQRFGVDFRYGLGWLDASSFGDHTIPGGWLLNGLNASTVRGWITPSFAGPPLAPFTLERMALGGFIGLGEAMRLHLGYEHAEGPLALFPSELGGSWAGGSQDSISLGIGYGRFYGGLTGRQLRPTDPALGQQGATNSLDLGFSWRMPWNAELEFGARNLITTPAKPEVPDRSQQGDLRVPYLRYHQEL